MHKLFQPIELPCGVILKNRIAKSAMSDSLGDGCGNPTDTQIRLYERWASGGVAASIIGEVQCTPNFAEKPGNLVLRADSDRDKFTELARRGSAHETQLWLQLGHAGAMAHIPISMPRGPSQIEIPGLSCSALTLEEIQNLPREFAQTASLAQDLGFEGVQIHAAHGFLLSQFLSPLFNKRNDAYGGSLVSRMRLLLEVVEQVRKDVSPSFVIAVKLNATDQLEGGFEGHEALDVISALDATGIDLIDISGGTYFPGAKSASDSAGTGPYFIDFAKQARARTTKPLMVTGGFKTRKHAEDAIADGGVDLVGIARGLVIDPALANNWNTNKAVEPEFPRFMSPPEGGITAWYTMRLTQIGEDHESEHILGLQDAASEVVSEAVSEAVRQYEERDNNRVAMWLNKFQ